MLTRRIAVFFCFIALAFLAGCEQPPPQAGTFPPEEKSQPVIVTPPPPMAASAARVLAPAGQVPGWLKEQWEKKLGGNVMLDVYASDNEALEKLRSGQPVYDLVLISDRIIAPLIKDQKLAALPANQPSLKADPKFSHHYFDSTNHYVMPYAYSLSGIAYRPAEVKQAPQKWADVFSDSNLKRAFLPDDSQLVAKLSGKQNLKGAAASQSPVLAVADVAKVKEVANPAATNAPPTTESVPVLPPIQINSMAALKKQFSGDKAWRFVLPEEGSALYMYHAAVPVGALADGPSVALLVELFDPNTLAKVASENDLAVTLSAALKQVPSTLAQDPQVYPAERILNKSYFIRK
jgi:spermidine/putrescine transport system substrate-binding protein